MTGRFWLCVVLALGAAGCGVSHRAAPAAVSPGGMRFVATAPPAGVTLGRGPINLVFVTSRRGFAATTGGSRNVAREGWVLPSEPGEIERTADGGATWRTLWRGHLAFDSLAVRGRVIVAAGLRERERDRRSAWFSQFRRHVLIVSRDGGRTWSRRRLPIHGMVTLLLPAPRLWLAFRARDPFGGRARPVLLRSDDAGRHWHELPLPAGAAVLRFGTPATGLASAYAQACRGGTRADDEPRTQLWRTTDDGLIWRPIAGTCASPYTEADLDFVTPRLAFAVQGNADIEQFRGVLRRSEDGGATWTTVAREHGREPFRVQFADRRHGTLVETVRVPPGLQDERLLLATTTDGGRTWARHGLPADSVGSGDAVTPSPAIRGRDVWVGHTRAGLIWHTRDGGRYWTLTTAPRSLDPGSEGFSRALEVGPGRLTASSAAGTVESRDGGRTWTLGGWPSALQTARDEGRGAYVVEGERQDRARLVTPTGSQPLTLPRGVRHIAEVAFANARDGLLVAYHLDEDDETAYVTRDGGATWARIAPRRRAWQHNSFAVAPGVIVHATDHDVSVSTDAGASWQPLGHLPLYPGCAASRPQGPDVWILCNTLTRTTLFFSGDDGRTWTRRVTHRLLLQSLSATGGAQAWATRADQHVDNDETSTLWHTADGGATWTQAWVSLPPRARAREIDCQIMPSGVLHAPVTACR